MPAIKLKAEDFAELLKDPLVASALAKSLQPLLSLAMEESIGKRLDALKSQLCEVQTDNTRISKKCETLQAENVELRKMFDAHDGRIEASERYSRRDNIIITGLPEDSFAERATRPASGNLAAPSESHASVESTVLEFIQSTLGVDIAARDIAIAHRLRAGKNDQTRPIIVRFNNFRSRNLVIGARKKLKDDSHTKGKVFISEHLTKLAAELFFDARRMVREKKVFGAWTHNGEIFVKIDNNATTKGTLISCKADLRNVV
jgi:hypothetical protein